LEYRRDNGPFATVDDIINVKGIGPKKLEKMRPFLRL
jgi:competence protein ComEA